jgi:hypothetical protein
MKLKSLLVAVTLALTAVTPLNAQAPVLLFSTPAAVGAKSRHDQAATSATQQYLRELNAAMKSAMQFNNLEEANLIGAVSKSVLANGSGEGDFKTASAKSAKARYTQALITAKKAYSRELEVAGKSALLASNLEEANAINATRTKLDEELKSLGAGPAPSTAVFGLAPPNSATRPGLLVREFPRDKSQTDGGHAELPLESMGEPLKKTFTIRTLAEWKYGPERNAVASGYIKIEKDGEYAFNSQNFYDRNSLMVDGQVVCKYRDGDKTVATIILKAGMVPIISIGYVEARGTVKVRWKPPGQTELGEIPGKLLFH